MDPAAQLLTKVFKRLGWPREIATELAAAGHIVHYEKGATIFRAGEVADLAYILVKGQARVFYSAAEKSRLLVHIASDRNLLGNLSLERLSTSRAHPVQTFSAEASSRCQVGLVSRLRLTDSLEALPSSVVIDILNEADHFWAHLSRRLLTFMGSGVRDRLLHLFHEMADAMGIQNSRGRLIPLRLSQEELAQFVGASRPLVNRHLKEFVAAGVLARQGGQYILCDLARPQDLPDERRGPRGVRGTEPEKEPQNALGSLSE